MNIGLFYPFFPFTPGAPLHRPLSPIPVYESFFSLLVLSQTITFFDFLESFRRLSSLKKLESSGEESPRKLSGNPRQKLISNHIFYYVFIMDSKNILMIFYTVGRANAYFDKNMLLLKNPQYCGFLIKAYICQSTH